MQFQAYGLSFECDTEIPELRAGGAARPRAAADLQIRLRVRRRSRMRPLGLISVRRQPDGRLWMRSIRVRDGFLLRFPEIADFHVNEDGSSVECIRRAVTTTSATLRHLLLDHVFPMVLNLRGADAIHATAVVVRRRAIAFLAPAGTGKSTLAASFLCKGFRALGDDCLVIRDTTPLKAVSAYPGFRLWNDSAMALSADLRSAQPVAGYSDKVRIFAAECEASDPHRPSPLARIYRLSRGRFARRKIRYPAVEPVAPRDALMELVRASFPLDVFDRSMLKRHFRLMGRLAAEVPMRRVLIPDDFAALPAVRAEILSDLNRETRPHVNNGPIAGRSGGKRSGLR